MASACSPSVSNAVASSGRRQRAAVCRSRRHSSPCCPKASTGGGRNVPGSRSAQRKFPWGDAHNNARLPYTSRMESASDPLPDDVGTLKRLLIRGGQLIEKLKAQIARL